MYWAYEGAKSTKEEPNKFTNSDVPKIGLPPSLMSELPGMRGKLAHAVETQNLDIVWSTVSKEIPEAMSSLLRALGGTSFNWLSQGDTPAQREARALIMNEFVKTMQPIIDHHREALTEAQRHIQASMNAVVESMKKAMEDYARNALRGGRS